MAEEEMGKEVDERVGRREGGRDGALGFFLCWGRQWARGKGALDSVTWSHPLDHLHRRF